MYLYYTTRSYVCNFAGLFCSTNINYVGQFCQCLVFWRNGFNGCFRLRMCSISASSFLGVFNLKKSHGFFLIFLFGLILDSKKYLKKRSFYASLFFLFKIVIPRTLKPLAIRLMKPVLATPVGTSPFFLNVWIIFPCVSVSVLT